MIRSVIKIQKVHHHAEPEAINQISQRPTEDAGKAQGRQETHPSVVRPVIEDEKDCENGNRDKERAAKGGGGAREEAKGGPRV